jgi:glycosyltransferase involved in cell wall biosynthesis
LQLAVCGARPQALDPDATGMVKVSVIIPVFDAEATLRQAIESALSSSSDLELIVVDDGSTDATPSIIESYGTRVYRLRQVNAGPASARNAGVRCARGEYLAFLDADDRWLPGMLERTVAELDSDPDCVMAYGNLLMIDSDGHSLQTSLIRGEYAHAPSMDEILTRMWPIMPSAALIRRSAFEACGGFAEEFRGAGFEDAFLWLRLRERGHFRYVAEPLAAWRFSWFPQPLKVRPSARDSEIFVRLVRNHFGVDAAPLVQARVRAPRSILGYAGLRALNRGDRRTARRAFAQALRLDPYRMRNISRFIRTFLPIRFARSLSGRTGRAAADKWNESQPL